MRNCFFAIRDQEFVEVRVRANDGHLPNTCGKYDFIDARAKFNIAAEKFNHFRRVFSSMGESHADWHQVEACQLPAHTNQRRHKKFDLMQILVSANTDILERYANIFALNISQRYTFICDPAISRCPLQGVTQYVRGGRDIIEQS